MVLETDSVGNVVSMSGLCLGSFDGKAVQSLTACLATFWIFILMLSSSDDFVIFNNADA